MKHTASFQLRLLLWVRANPLGPALTVCFAGLVAILLLPSLSLKLFGSSRLVLIEVLLAAPLVPYAVIRVHQTAWKPLAGLWALTYIAALASPPVALKYMGVMALSAHFTQWFFWASALTAAWAFFAAANSKSPSVTQRTQKSTHRQAA